MGNLVVELLMLALFIGMILIAIVWVIVPDNIKPSDSGCVSVNCVKQLGSDECLPSARRYR